MSLALSAILEAVIEKLIAQNDERALVLAIDGRMLLDRLARATPEQKSACWVDITTWQRLALEHVTATKARTK